MKYLLDSFKMMDDESKKKIKIFGIGAIGIIVLIIIISIIFAIVNRKTSYENMEQIMANAAYEYYQNNLSKLPNESIRTSVVDENTLVNEKFMKPIKKYTKDESCKGNVVVTYNNNDYDYQAYLTCNDFVTTLFSDKLKKDNSIVTTGAGLYDETEILRFRGEHVNNYLKINDIIYRIIKIDSENKIYITPQDMDDKDESIYVYWDDRYNTEADLSCGINNYSLSRIKDSLEKVYSKLDKQLKENTTTFTACTANRLDSDANNTGSTECSIQMENVNISLIPIYEYIKASIAPACTTPASKECKNYNYLYNEKYRWWTNTGDASNTDKIYYVNYSGEIEKDRGFSKMISRYVVALKPNTLLKDGNGTEENPYTIR